ncbi:unnamed protein product [Rodentolepis nana]|uniref:FERM domain-containing protein n=1 Tax=Rodentolepis nana TaxID=102285 RepID=A0A0R3TZS9_RODNA|nr:unnamed protein product [Rodentolepis nana]
MQTATKGVTLRKKIFQNEILEIRGSYVPATAELEYLQIARRLELYGIHPEGVTDRNRTKLNIGVSFQGISVLLEMKRIYLYTWDNVEKIVFSGKTFSVSLKHRPVSFSISEIISSPY